MSKLIWENLPYPGVEIEDVNDDLILENIRFARGPVLAATDWTQLPDAPVDSAAWAIYRQQLRDLPESGPAKTLIWPTRP